jgi:hypothetical protein
MFERLNKRHDFWICHCEAAEGGRGNPDVDQHSLAVLRTSQQVGNKPESGNPV